MMKKDNWIKNAGMMITLGILSIIALYTVYSLEIFQENNYEKQEENIKEVIHKDIIQCYALEGAYPPNLQYLEDNYAIILDEEHYIYHYVMEEDYLFPEVDVWVIAYDRSENEGDEYFEEVSEKN